MGGPPGPVWRNLQVGPAVHLYLDHQGQCCSSGVGFERFSGWWVRVDESFRLADGVGCVDAGRC